MERQLIFLTQYFFKSEILLNVKSLQLFKNRIKNLITIFLLTALTAQAFELSEEVFQAEQAVYKVTKANGSSGTGFFIAPDLFVTNFHVIDEVESLDDISLDHQDRPSISIRNIIAVSIFADLAILQTEEKSPVYLSEGELASLDENLVIIGHVGGADRAEIIKSTEASSLWEDIVYETPTDFSGESFGLSGSPLINLDGEFLGVVCESSSNIKTSTISQYVSNLLEGHLGTLCESFECIDQESQKMQELVIHQLRRGVLESEPTLFHNNLMLLKTFLNPEDLISYLSLGGEEGSAIAQYNLGFSYSKGQNGVEQDLKRAAEFYQQAAQLGLAEATYNLGTFYDEGKGVERNLTKAVELYQQAAQLGHAGAIYNLGVSYSEGSGVQQDLTKAVELYQQAAQLGHAGAIYNLGVSYSEGLGVQQDLTKAVELYQQAAQLGHTSAQNNLGIALYKGKGVKRDIPEAVVWLKKAAEQGHSNSQKTLSFIHTEWVLKKTQK